MTEQASVTPLPPAKSRQTERASQPPAFSRGLAVRVWIAFLATILIFGGVGVWLATAQIAGAIIASGVVVVESNVKRVQHSAGGIVGEILVKNGDHVTPGQVVVRLDDTQTRAALGIVVSQLIELRGRKARLTAERDDATTIEYPEGFENDGPSSARVAAGERELLESRRLILQVQKSQLGERIEQLTLEGRGLTSQHDAKVTELKLVREELGRLRDLYQKNLVAVTRILAMQREEARINGEQGALLAQIGRSGGQIAEIKVQIANLEQTMRTEAQKELREVEGRIAELEERRVAAEDQLKRIDIRAPQGGMVHELGVHTVGGVIGPAETLMQVVPTGETLAVEIRLAPTDIDQATIGQTATLRFVAFNQRTTPEVSGVISRIGADSSKETQTGNAYYTARIGLDGDTLSRLGAVKLLPGMPVEAYITTTQRSALSFFLKPFEDQIRHVFVEE